MSDTDTPLQLDSAGLFQVLSMLNKKSMGDDISPLDDDVFHRLTDFELEILFRNSTLIQKIIKKYPTEAKAIGYELHDTQGNILQKNNETLLEAIKEASIFSRLYSKCFLYLQLSDSLLDSRPVKKGAIITGYEIYFDLIRDGDFFTIDDKKIHYQRIIEFVGTRTYVKNLRDSTNINYADSVLQGVFKSLQDYVENNDNAKRILQNLSYLTIGIDNLGNMSRSDEGKTMIYDRLTTLNLNRNINRTIAYDKKSEEMNFISQTLSGVREIIESIKEIFISETDYPLEELFEQAPSQKLGSGVQNQLIARYLWARRCRNWAINNWMPYYKIYFDRTLDMSQITINIPFIVDLTDEERANIENIAADRTTKLVNAGVISVEEARTGYKTDSFTLNIELNKNITEPVLSIPASTQDDADVIPDDSYWDNLANVTTEYLDNIAEKILQNE